MHVVPDGSDADDLEVGVRTIGSTVFGLHPPSSSQSDEAASFRFSLLAAGGGAFGQPQVFGNSSHSKVIHCPA